VIRVTIALVVLPSCNVYPNQFVPSLTNRAFGPRSTQKGTPMGNFDQYGSPVFTVRMHRDLWKRIAERCEAMKTNRSDFVRKAVETALKEKPENTNHAK
jgi:hypothetical protein